MPRHLLGVVAERAAGAPLAHLVANHLWAPPGAEHDAELTLDPAGTAASGGGFCATLRDYTRLGALVAARAVSCPSPGYRGWGTRTPPRSLRGPTQKACPADGYRNQWWRRDGSPMARGIHGRLTTADPYAEVVVTILSSWPDAVEIVLEAEHRRFVAEVCARLA